jgi:F-type H+-transporting ATPase subunit delta
MMAESITIARPYAKASFEAAKANDALDAWSSMLAYASAIAEDENMVVVLDHPALTSKAKADAFIDVCGDKLNDQGKNLIFVLSENDRIGLLPDIAILFEALKAQLEQSVDVLIESAFDLGSEQQEKLAQALSKKLDRKVNVTSTVNESLMGGAIVRANDLVIDASVRGKLAKLAEAVSA